MTPAIETAGLTRDFDGFRALDDLHLCVERGRFFGFLGPNGAGKSTTIKLLTGLLAPTSGRMRLLGVDMANSAHALDVKRRVGVVPENLALFDNLTGWEYLTFVGRMYELEPAVLKQRREELLELMNLAHETKKLTLEYSHGMKKKLALAAVLLPNPELLFFDEPFEGVDAVAAAMLREPLRRVVEQGATVFLTSHVLEIVEKLCTDVAILAHGKLVLQGTMEALKGSGTLEQRFLEVVGEKGAPAHTLSWLQSGSAGT